MADADIADITALKYAYFRLLDSKRFEELGSLLTDDVTTAYDSGNLAQRGRDEVVAFLQGSLGGPGIVTMHTGHHPEIAVSGDEATGTWYLEDRVIVPAADLVISGTALYSDRYVRDSSGWRIAHTGYDRLYEEHRTHRSGELRSFRSRFGDPG